MRRRAAAGALFAALSSSFAIAPTEEGRGGVIPLPSMRSIFGVRWRQPPLSKRRLLPPHSKAASPRRSFESGMLQHLGADDGFVRHRRRHVAQVARGQPGAEDVVEGEEAGVVEL